MKHHKIIKSLISEIRGLRKENNQLLNDLDNANGELEYNESQQARVGKRNQQLRDENSRIEREREYERQEAETKDWQRKELLTKLERAESWGDEWGVDRIKRDLKNL